MSHVDPHFSPKGECNCDCDDCTMVEDFILICTCPECEREFCGMHAQPTERA